MNPESEYEYLGRIRKMKRNIERLDEQIAVLRYSLLPGAINYDKDRVNTSPKDTLTETFCRIDELTRQRNALEFQSNDLAYQLCMEINTSVPAGKERSFLLRYYIHCEDMQHIADELNISMRHCFRIRSNAMRQFMANVLGDNE